MRLVSWLSLGLLVFSLHSPHVAAEDGAERATPAEVGRAFRRAMYQDKLGQYPLDVVKYARAFMAISDPQRDAVERHEIAAAEARARAQLAVVSLQIEALDAQVSFVRLARDERVSPAEVLEDGPRRWLLLPGNYSFALSAPGYPDERRSFTAEQGQVSVFGAEHPPAHEPEPVLPATQESELTSRRYEPGPERQRRALGTRALRIGGGALWLSALALDITLHLRAHTLAGDASEQVAADAQRYRRMHRAAGPLAGVSAVFSTSGIAWGTLHNRLVLPRAMSVPLIFLGIGLTVAGALQRHRTPADIGESTLRQPTHVDGALLIGAGLPVLTWGITDGLLHLLASNMH